MSMDHSNQSTTATKQLQFSPGELVILQVWDCEGIENPWGWTKASEVKKNSQVRRKRLAPGSVAIVIGFDVNLGIDFDVHYNLLINEQTLSVPIRFMHRVQTDEDCL